MEKEVTREQLKAELKGLNQQIRAKLTEVAKIRAKKREIKQSETWKRKDQR